MLKKTLKAIVASSRPPELIVVVDNNDEPKYNSAEWPYKNVRLIRLPCDFHTHGPEQGHQTALRVAFKFHYDIMVRWDDDLVPEPDCIVRLVHHIHTGDIAACGGMYPRPNDDKRSSAEKTGDGNPRHLQFFVWEGKHRTINVRHLYSSFAYDVRSALSIGGFCPFYSRFGQGGETDFTLRMKHSGGSLLVDTAAKAIHYWAAGGRRFSDPEMIAASAYDNDLFRTRMIEHKIDPEKW